MTLERLQRALEQVIGPVTATDVADTLWLAQFLPGRPAESTVPSAAEEESDVAPRSRTRNPAVGIHRTRVTGRITAVSSPESATIPLRTGSPSQPGRAGSLRVLRSMRPLKRRTPSQQRLEVDEALTVDQIARGQLVPPAMRPVRDRWLDLSLVVDDSPLSGLWHDTIDDFLETCRYLGAFRTIGIHYLRYADGRIVLAPGRQKQGGLHPARSLVTNGARQQIILVFTDALGATWTSGAAQQAIAWWANDVPVAVVQPLPERLWRHTFLGTVSGHLDAPHRGAPSAALRLDGRRHTAGSAVAGSPIPVLELDEHWLRPWSHLTAGTSSRGADVAVTMVAKHGPQRHFEPEPMARLDAPGERALALRASVGPDAYRLAGLLAAAAPLVVPVMRHIQSVFLPKTGPTQLAELFLAGLLVPVAETATLTLFDISPEVRSALRSTLRRHEVAAVIAAVSDCLTSMSPATGSVPFPGIPEKDVLHTEFARVASPLLRRLGIQAETLLRPGVAPMAEPRQPAPAQPPGPPHDQNVWHATLIVDVGMSPIGTWPDEVGGWLIGHRSDGLTSRLIVHCEPTQHGVERGVVNLVAWAEAESADAYLTLRWIDFVLPAELAVSWRPEDVDLGVRLGNYYDIRLRWSTSLRPGPRHSYSRWRQCLQSADLDAPIAWHRASINASPPTLYGELGSSRAVAVGLVDGPPTPEVLSLALTYVPAVVWPARGAVTVERQQLLTARDVFAGLHSLNARDADPLSARAAPFELRAVCHDEEWISFVQAFSLIRAPDVR